MQKTKTSRREVFDQVEKSELHPLPLERYSQKKFLKATVQFNYHIYLAEDKHYYSVPYQHRGKKVDIIASEATVEIFYSHLRIAFHKRDRSLNKYTTSEEHMPSKHLWVAKWSPERFIKWASETGVFTKEIIETILDKCSHPEQGFKVCMGILNLYKKYGSVRVEKACKRALYFQHYSFQGVKKILENNLEDFEEDQLLFSPLPDHENIRGHRYYEGSR